MPASYLPDLENTTPNDDPAPASASPHANGGSPTPANPRTSPRHWTSGRSPGPPPTWCCNSAGRVASGSWESKVESGSLMHHPRNRRTTTQYLAVAVLGSEEERAAFREAVNTRTGMHSGFGKPVKYNAFNKEPRYGRRMLVHRLRGHPPAAARGDDRGEAEASTSRQTTGHHIAGAGLDVAATRADFDHYWNVGCERVVIDDKTATSSMTWSI